MVVGQKGLFSDMQCKAYLVTDTGRTNDAYRYLPHPYYRRRRYVCHQF